MKLVTPTFKFSRIIGVVIEAVLSLSAIPNRTLNAEMECVPLAKAAHFGLPPDWVARLEDVDPERRQVSRHHWVAGFFASAVLVHDTLKLPIGDCCSGRDGGRGRVGRCCAPTEASVEPTCLWGLFHGCVTPLT